MNDSNDRRIDEQDLDRHIHGLLAWAVADAPAPPALDEPMSFDPDRRSDRRTNPWMIGGAVLAVAAMAAGAFILPNLGDDSVIDTVQTSTSQLPPSETTTTVEPQTTTTDSATTDTTDGSSETTPDPPAAVVEPATMVMSAGPAGITVQPLDGSAPTTVGNPAWFAVAGPDGRIYYQPFSAVGDGEGVRQFEAVDPETGAIEVIDLGLVPSVTATLQDVTEVDGEVTVVFVTDRPQCSSPEDPQCTTSLLAIQPDTGRSFVIAGSNAWEFVWGRFSATSDGRIAGSAQDLATEVPQFFSLGPVEPPTPVSLGLDDSYFDCNECPESFTIDRSGSFVAWIEGPVGQRRLVVTDVVTGEQAQQSIEVSGPDGYLRIADVEIADGEIVGGRVAFTQFSYERTTTPILIDLSTGSVTELTPGTVATLG